MHIDQRPLGIQKNNDIDDGQTNPRILKKNVEIKKWNFTEGVIKMKIIIEKITG